MARKLKFDLTVDANALLCPNPNEFYSKAYISEDIVDNYRTLAGIKYKTKIANQLFDANLLKASSCTWSVGTDPLNAVEIDVCAVSAMAQICRFNIEQVRWKGNTAVNSNDVYELCTGYEAKLCADADVVQIVNTTVTASNVITEMNKL